MDLAKYINPVHLPALALMEPKWCSCDRFYFSCCLGPWLLFCFFICYHWLCSKANSPPLSLLFFSEHPPLWKSHIYDALCMIYNYSCKLLAPSLICEILSGIYWQFGVMKEVNGNRTQGTMHRHFVLSWPNFHRWSKVNYDGCSVAFPCS
jgi:hypothetical protein